MISRFFSGVLLTLFILSSCVKEDLQYDCPDLELNYNSACVLSISDRPDLTVGFVSANCECLVPMREFDCPDLMAYIGDLCRNTSGSLGRISENCDCFIGNVNGKFDCMHLEVNFGDLCRDASNYLGRIDKNCMCLIHTGNIYDCPDLKLNIGDACDRKDDGSISYVNEDCLCR